MINILVIAGLLVGLTRGLAASRERQAQLSHPPKGQIIEVDGTPVHVLIKGSGPDLVLIHGAGGNINDFDFDLIDRLTDRFRVIAFDRPGLGHSGRIAPVYSKVWGTQAESIAEQAALLQAAAAQLGAQTPLILGHSFGAAVTLAWAVNHPGTYRGLVLVGGVSNPWPGSLSPLYRINASAPGGALAVPLQTAFATQGMIDASLTGIFAPDPMPQGYGEAIGVGLSIGRDATRANARMVWNLRPQVVEISQRYGDIDVPVEIIHGTADTIVPLEVHSRPLSTQIPGAVLTEIDGAGHMPHHSHPKVIVDAIDRVEER